MVEKKSIVVLMILLESESTRWLNMILDGYYMVIRYLYLNIRYLINQIQVNDGY